MVGQIKEPNPWLSQKGTHAVAVFALNMYSGSFGDLSRFFEVHDYIVLLSLYLVYNDFIKTTKPFERNIRSIDAA